MDTDWKDSSISQGWGILLFFLEKEDPPAQLPIAVETSVTLTS